MISRGEAFRELLGKAGFAYRNAGKRILDVLLSSLALLILSPILGIVAILIRISLGRPVLFRQTRPGVGGNPFELLKFRSMFIAIDQEGKLLPDAERLTTLGRRLRGWSLDELPTLWNVLRGDMSLVGPRPLLLQYLSRYTPEQARRHEVRPGITGLAQVNGRNALTWEEKFQFDVWYVDHVSLLLDLKILCKTVWSVSRREGISAQDHATMPEYFGSGQDR